MIVELSEDQILTLKEFKLNVKDVLKPHHDDRFLLRWLRARNFDIVKAEKMLREDIKFRKKIGSDTILEDFELRKELQPYDSTIFLGFDNAGHGVRLFNLTAVDLKGFVRSLTVLDIIKHIIHIIEHDTKLQEENCLKTDKCVFKKVFIANINDLKMRIMCDKQIIKLSIQIIKMYLDHYPETMHSVHVLNAPLIFSYVFNSFKPLLDETVLNKVHIYSSGDESWKKTLLSTIPSSIIPAFLGGALHAPEADPMCTALLNWRTKVPSMYYLNETATMSVTDPGVHEIVIRKRSSFEVQIEIEQEGQLLCWEFQTKDYNIRFGLSYKAFKTSKKKGKTPREELLAVETVESHDIVEKGEFACERPGIYILQFDNTYSWMTPKHLLYKYSIQEAKKYADVEFIHE